MRIFILLTIVACISAKHISRDLDVGNGESIDAFDEEFGELAVGEEQAAEEENLLEAEASIEKNNEDPSANFQEGLWEGAVLSTQEFEKEKTGFIAEENEDDEVRSFGLIPTPLEDQIISPEDQAILDSVYANRGTCGSYYSSLDKGLVTVAKNQMSCGSCAAFASTGLHEVCLRKAGVPSDGLDLSEQQPIDCGYEYKGQAHACDGATIGVYPTYMTDKELNHESDYPYQDTQPAKYCQHKKYWSAGAKIVKSLNEYRCDEDKLEALVCQYGAVATAIYASDRSFGCYKSGTYDGCTKGLGDQNHAVLVVGYTPDYWIVKNSWGANWGNQGFVHMKRGVNMCGIGTQCTVAECAASGTWEMPPPAPTPAPIPPNQQCNVSKLFKRSDITGSYTLRFTSNGVEHVSKVKCENSVCTPQIAGPSNCCMYICGKVEC